MNEFEKDIHIDPEQLDVECTQQPELFWKYAERAAEARGEEDRSKFRMEVLEAELQMDCRKNPASFGLEKVTEASITAAVRKSQKYQEAVGEYHTARENSAMCAKAVVAMEQKKRMLESLVTLHGQQYFAGPATPRDLGAAWQSQKEARDTKFKKKMKRKVRKRKRDK